LTATAFLSNIALQWEGVPDQYLPDVFQGYQVFSLEGSTKQIADLKPIGDKVAELQKDVVRLKPATKYTLAVAAFSNSLRGPFSEMIEVETSSGMVGLSNSL